jgi:hypothetical protein
MTPDPENVGRSVDTQETDPTKFPPRQKGRGSGSWHAEARTMRADGMRYADIARAFGVTPCAVYFVINPDKRWKKHDRQPTSAAPAAD